MRVGRRTSQATCGVLLLAGATWASAQQVPVLPYEPPKQFGASITGAFEGWFDSGEAFDRTRSSFAFVP